MFSVMSSFLELAKAVQIALRALQLYSPAHPRTVEAMQSIQAALAAQMGDARKLQVSAASGRLLVNREAADRTNVHVAALLRQMEERNMQGLLLLQGITPSELEAL